jgi:hypothetical protein
MLTDPRSETKFLMKEGNSENKICNIQCFGGNERTDDACDHGKGYNNDTF